MPIVLRISECLLILPQGSFQVTLRVKHRSNIVVRRCHRQGIGCLAFLNLECLVILAQGSFQVTLMSKAPIQYCCTTLPQSRNWVPRVLESRVPCDIGARLLPSHLDDLSTDPILLYDVATIKELGASRS